MATSYEIEGFLQDFKTKLSIWGIFFRDDRSKNANTLLELEIYPVDREKIVKQLNASDYYQGPIPDTLNKDADMWVFKKSVKGKMVYIKISLGIPCSKVICISFHT